MGFLASAGIGAVAVENVSVRAYVQLPAPLGERKDCTPVTQAQTAATIAAFLGEDIRTAAPKAAAPITDVLPK